ncbi:MAG TPA: carboxypeptidase-like regulatory domain-containing protein [Gemmatimonadaceae bacterium]|nr:carboxypeptidase-like regulatory domain-containing protein [Gemmatimonadaceae bacterium]
MTTCGVAIPSALSAQTRPAATAAPTGVEGIVVDSAGRPLANAKLVVRDTARIGTAALRRNAAESDSLGRFRIVDLPPGAHVLEVQREEYEPAGFRFDIATGVTAQLRITLQKDPLWAEMKRAADSILVAEREDSIARARVDASAPPGVAFGKGTLVGRVLGDDGKPVARVQVQAMGTNFFTQTDMAGRFRLAELPVGPYFLRARKVGYDPVVFGATIVRGDSVDASVTLTAFTAARGQNLDTVRVTAQASRRRQGFEERRVAGRGFFVDREEVLRRRPQGLSDLLRGRANVQVERNSTTGEAVVYGPRLSIGGGFCPLALIIDGTLISNLQGGIDAYVPVDMIAGVEVYNSGTSVPSQFARLGTDCGAIIVWTR